MSERKFHENLIILKCDIMLLLYSRGVNNLQLVTLLKNIEVNIAESYKKLYKQNTIQN